MDINLPNGRILEGTNPIVIIGPNGAGKTRFAIDLKRRHENTDRIAAIRNLDINQTINMQVAELAEADVINQLQNILSNPWQSSNEFNSLLSKLKADDAQSAIKFRNEYMREHKGVPPETTISKLTKFWENLFPERNIDLETYQPKVVSKRENNSLNYFASNMSDGERVALYLAARVLDSKATVMIVDEPEVHFHSHLAKLFWNELETFRPDCRFIYVTHDLNFAVSRKNPTFVILKSPNDLEISEDILDLPNDIIESILGAASFSINAKKIIFCEGKSRGSLDKEIYSSWYNNKDTVVMPVDSCETVIKCVEVLSTDKIIRNISVQGIIDRDYLPDEFCKTLPSGVHVLQLHEIESLLCLEDIFVYVGICLSKDTQLLQRLYNEFIEDAKKLLKSKKGMFNKQVKERARERVEIESRNLLNQIKLDNDIGQVEQNFLHSVDPTKWATTPQKIFDEEKQRVTDALNGNMETFLSIFPGKTFLSAACQKLGLDETNYLMFVKKALSGKDSDTKPPEKVEYRDKLIDLFKKHLPAK